MIDRSADVYALDQQGGKGGANYMVNTMCTILSDSHGTPHAIAYKNVINSSGGGVAGTLDSHYWKGCGERQGAEREFVAVKKRGVDDLPKDNRASDGE